MFFFRTRLIIQVNSIPSFLIFKCISSHIFYLFMCLVFLQTKLLETPGFPLSANEAISESDYSIYVWSHCKRVLLGFLRFYINLEDLKEQKA